jgi:hypothetical protein
MKQKDKQREKHFFKDRKRKATSAKIQRKEDKYGLETPPYEYGRSSVRPLAA